jgi:hypothetical protein
MRRVVFVIMLALVVSTCIHPTRAQDAKPVCDPAAVIKKAAALAATGDPAKDMDALLALRDVISAANVACTGYTFKGKGEKIVPPFTLTKAFYKVTANTDGFLIVDIRSMEGSDCKAGVKHNLFILDDTQAKLGAETTLDMTVDCRAILEVSNTRTDWTITFEPLK